MSFAPHTNDDVQRQLAAGLVPTPLPLIFGQFRNERGILYEYAERRHPDDEFAPAMPHVIYLCDGSTRLAKVLRTVAWVCTNEDHNGPVVQKWAIKQHREYPTEWVRG